MHSITHKQSELLAYIKQYLADNGGVAPSFDEMREAVGLASKSGVHRLMDGLEERGLVSRIPMRRRALKVHEPDLLHEYPTSALIAELARRREEAPQREVRAASIRRERAAN